MNVMLAEALPSPDWNVRFVFVCSATVPPVAESVICSVGASTSATPIALPLVGANTSVPSSPMNWLVGTVTTGASFTPVTVNEMVSVSLCADPPVFPWSFERRVTEAVPTKFGFGTNVVPSSAAFTAERLPVNVIVASPLPVPAVKVSPEVPPRETLPFVPLRVTLINPALRSASEMLSPVPALAAKVNEPSSATVCAPGTAFTGGSLSDAQVITIESESWPAPPLPELPLSSVSTVSTLVPMKFAGGVTVSPLSAELMLTGVPEKVIVASERPSPVVNSSPATVGRVISVPLSAVRVTRSWLAPTSTSETRIELKVFGTSSMAAWPEVGTVFTGASLIDVTVRVSVSRSLSPFESVVLTVSVAAPLKFAVGTYFELLSAAFSALSVPWMVTVRVPSPASEPRPVVEPSLKMPLVTESCTVSVALFASVTESAFPAPVEKVSWVSSIVCCGVGSVFTGWVLTAVTVTVTVAIAVPPLPSERV